MKKFPPKTQQDPDELFVSLKDLAVVKKLPDLYGHITRDGPWTPLLDLMGDLVGAKGVMLYVNDSSQVQYSVNASNRTWQGQSDLLTDHMNRFGHYEMQAMAFMSRAKPLKLYTEAEAYGVSIEELSQRADIENVRQAMGLFRRVGMRFDVVESVNAGIIFQFDEKHPEVPETSMRRAGLLAPHISKVVQLQRFFLPLLHRYQAVLSVLDRLDVGICLANAMGEVLILNASADQILSDKNGLFLNTRRKLCCTDASVEERVRLAISNAARTAEGRNTSSGDEIAVPKRSADKAGFLLAISPIFDGLAEFESAFAGAIVTIVDPDRPTVIDVAPFCNLYHLTSSETEVAELLVKGMKIEDISERRNVSLETTRTQIKSVYLKTGVSSRHQFIWKLIQYTPPVS